MWALPISYLLATDVVYVEMYKMRTQKLFSLISFNEMLEADPILNKNSPRFSDIVTSYSLGKSCPT